MRFRVLCDENIPETVITSLQKWGFNVSKPTRGSSDSEVAALARREKRIFITFDADFTNILSYPPKDFYGIIRIAIKPPLINTAVDALKNVFAKFKTQEAFRGKLIILDASSFRIWEKAPRKIKS